MIASAATAAAASPLGSLFNHSKRGVNSASPSAGGSAQPASTVSLFGSLLQSVEQVVGIPAAAAPAGISSTAAAGSTGATAGTSATAGTGAATAASPAQQVQSFLYSLFQALKAGLGTPGAAGTAASGTATGSGSSAGQYAGSLASSLQSLIQQLGSGGSASPQVANLESAFSGLIGASSGSAGSTAAAASTSNASLQGLLTNLLQNVQSAGASSIPTVGSAVNAKA
jgi:hypothetical protein